MLNAQFLTQLCRPTMFPLFIAHCKVITDCCIGTIKHPCTFNEMPLCLGWSPIRTPCPTPVGDFDDRQQLETTESVRRCCGSGRETRSPKLGRLCPEGKPLFSHCGLCRHGRTRIEPPTSLDVLGGKLC